jgi:hypothetical protein
MNYEIACNPIPSADVPGYTFRRVHNGCTIAAWLAGLPSLSGRVMRGEARHARASRF